MADDDLKANLNLLMRSEGKTFFWGFGAGKRKPPHKPGDGLLRVFRSRSQVKKKDFQEGCECSQFVQGKCWAQGDEIKVAGQGLGGGLLAKMKLAARTETGVGYELVLATDEEAASRGEGEEAGEVQGEEKGKDGAPPPTGDGAKAPTDPGEAYRGALAKMAGLLKQALALGGPVAAEIKQLYAQADAYARKNEFKAALVQLIQLKRRAEEALKAAPTETPTDGKTDLGLWTTARSEAVKHVRFCQAELLKTHDPECIEAAKVLNEVSTRLNAPLASLADVEGMEKYVGDEELIGLMDREKFFGVAVDLRKSLLSTLEVVKAQLAS